MDTRSIRVQKGHPDTPNGRLIKSLCREIDRLNRKVIIQQHLLKQVVQLNQRKSSRRMAA